MMASLFGDAPNGDKKKLLKLEISDNESSEGEVTVSVVMRAADGSDIVLGDINVSADELERAARAFG